MTWLTLPTLWIVLVALLAVIIFTPRYGILARWRSRRTLGQRELLEDTLKIIFNLHQEGSPVDQYRLAVDLGLTLKDVQALLMRMESQGLAVARHRAIDLTPEGKRWALQVIRAHRLWERYLADEARMPLEQVHTAAHRREHEMSAEEVDTLDAALGHPATDPHGDPIPSPSGDLREAKPSLPLGDVQAGHSCRIAQLEDEPPLAYAQLLAEGLYVGQSLTVLESTPERIVISDEDNEIRLARAIADNVYVQVDIPVQVMDPHALLLGSLPSRTKAEIIRIDDRCQGFTRRRFLDLGLTPGTTIVPELENIFKEPRGYRVRGTLIALRREQASYIWVRPEGSIPA